MDNNSINLGKIYGITRDCGGVPCIYSEDLIANTPTLEQIANYNLQLKAAQEGNPEITRRLRMLDGDSQALHPNIPTPPMQPTQPMMDQTYEPTDLTNMPDTDQLTQSGEYLTTPVTSGATPPELQPITEYNQPFPVTGESIQYLNGFMRTQIGRKIELQILVGTNTLVTKTGYLLGIGANFILISEIGTGDLTTCDFYNIKFVRYFYAN